MAPLQLPGAEDNLAMEVRALEQIVEASVDAVVDAEVPSLPLQLARAAVDAGHGADGFSRVVELLRRSA